VFLQKCDLRARRERREPATGTRERDGDCQNGRGGDAEGSRDGGATGCARRGTQGRRHGGTEATACNSQGPTAGTGNREPNSQGPQRRKQATGMGRGRRLSFRPVRGNCSLAPGFNPGTARPTPFFSHSFEPLQGRLRQGKALRIAERKEERRDRGPGRQQTKAATGNRGGIRITFMTA